MKKNLILSLAFAFSVLAFATPVSATHEGGSVPDVNDGNQASFWEDHFNDGSTCEKVFEAPEGQETDFYTLGEAPEGYEWTWIVVNAGQPGPGRNDITKNPQPGNYENSQTNDVSNVILCKKAISEEPEEPETPVTPETPTTPVAPSSTDVDEEEDQVEAPAAGVDAGSGNATTAAVAAVALIGSLASLGYGIVRFTKFGA